MHLFQTVEYKAGVAQSDGERGGPSAFSGMVKGVSGLGLHRLKAGNTVPLR